MLQHLTPHRRLRAWFIALVLATIVMLLPFPTEAEAADVHNPIEVPDHLLDEAYVEGTRDQCKYVDLSSIKPTPNPGFVGETVGANSLTGQTLWEVAFYLMVYTNCERQKAGLPPLKMYTGDKMVAMQQTYIGKSGHAGFGDRADIAGGGTAEQAFGTRLVLMPTDTFNEDYLDTDGNGVWSPFETARRVVSGASYFSGLVNHGGATWDPNKRCVFGTATLGPDESKWMRVVLFYGSSCEALGTFIDDEGSTFEASIEWIAEKGWTTGCNPPKNNQFCPDDHVTRGQFAVFLDKALGLKDNGGGDLFDDDDGRFYEDAADRLKAANVTNGCNPPANTRFCGDSRITRGEFAALMVRALGLTDDGGGNLFTDDNGHLFESAIDRLGAAKITAGCNPPTNDQFCPDEFVTRGQIAAFFERAFS